MRVTTFVTTLCFVFTAVATGPSVAFQSVVSRTTLLVSDIEKSIAFYEGIGFLNGLERSLDRDPKGGELPLNGKPEHFRLAIMSGQHPDWAMIGLLEFDNPPLPWTRDKDDPTIGTSDAVLVIVTDDLAQVQRNLLALDVPILSGPRDYSGNFVNGKKFGQVMVVQDPDGRVIEVLTEISRIEPDNE